ncbi:hypothetical protein [Natronomonas salsuginis]|uniref:Zinc ribbon domain-containing protein n=1 Tax=Natronomonas salsuginis TaxID=2217661 RepID=A0A4U5JEW0_9EURY|nr:hypothetical protein [Natronomonas salsuginis]TKR27892.1 hypothetical protein DM868_02055 [Natronomonas salsuginis]
MSTSDGGHRSEAVAAIADREYGTAGDRYTRAGRRVLADPRPDVDPFASDPKGWVGIGIGYLATAAVCYRVAGAGERATRRSVEGIAVARDLAAGLDRPVQRACLAEFVADFRVIGGTGDAATAYDEAADAYESSPPDERGPQYWGTTPLFEAAAAPIKQVARTLDNGEIAVTWEDLHGSDPADLGAFLGARPTYKRQRFPGLLERVTEAGVLAAPRGTTEYSTDHHRCPDCGSTDVNWAAENTLCLRCSRPTAEQ